MKLPEIRKAVERTKTIDEALVILAPEALIISVLVTPLEVHAKVGIGGVCAVAWGQDDPLSILKTAAGAWSRARKVADARGEQKPTKRAKP